MITEIRVDTERLRSHTDIVRAEQRCIYELLDHLRFAQSLAEEDISYRFRLLIEKVNQLSTICSLMIDSLEETSDIFDKLIEDIDAILTQQIEVSSPDLNGLIL